MNPSPSFRSWPLTATAVLCYVAALMLMKKASSSGSWLIWSGLAGLLLIAALGFSWLAWRSTRTSSPLASRVRSGLILGAILLCAPEIVALKSGVDWDEALGNEVTPRQTSPFFRMPSVRIESVFFRKPGPLHWEGRPLKLLLENSQAADTTYDDEPLMSADYDTQGFRNAPALADWDITVVGDSYTELGFLPQSELFTSVLAQRSGLRVKNLGASSSGPFTYECFFRHFGSAPSTRHAMFVVFEGNDVTDAEKESLALLDFQRTGRPPDREYHPQPSLLTAAWRAAPQWLHPPPRRQFANAWLKLSTQEVPVTLSDAWLPPAPETLTPRQKECFERALRQMHQAATAARVKPWLVLLPACNRLYAGRLRFSPSTPPAAAAWQKNDLPNYITTLAVKHGFTVIDTTPALQAAVDAGRMVYNPVRDFHFNAEGSRIVGETMAAALSQPAPSAAP